jgi:hypothetical protein
MPLITAPDQPSQADRHQLDGALAILPGGEDPANRPIRNDQPTTSGSTPVAEAE